ncbi:hypothetical protein [Alteribacillus sp. HJP-4]|uniref:hypothetical protein n=1 Tax=Alteribacillus sp. HJP-4 TaxID=2775394 RepID=UPI0035CD1C66
MLSDLNQQLQNALHEAIQHKNFTRAEEAVAHLKALSDMEAFIHGSEIRAGLRQVDLSVNQEATNDLLAPVAKKSAPVQASLNHQVNSQNASAAKRDTLYLYYIEAENLLKFKKSPQTYAVSLEFFQTFLENLSFWKGVDPFSSKDYYEHFTASLEKHSTYQASTMRQFITLLFRFSVKLEIIKKPEPNQRSRYVVNEDFDTTKLINYITDQKVLEL